MCGIVAFSGEDNFNPDKIKLLMLWNATERGKDSTGIFTPSLGVVKGIGEAKTFLNKKELLPETQFMGHVRSKTSGAATEKNAHPFEFENLIGVHNGTLNNIWGLLPEYGLKSVDYQVDSEALFAILNKTLDVKVIGKVIGAMALVWYYKKHECFYVYRNDERPLYYGTVDKGIYISSIKESLEVIDCKDIVEFKKEELYKIVKDNVIACDINIPKKLKPIPVIVNSQPKLDTNLFIGYWGRFAFDKKYIFTYENTHWHTCQRIDFDPSKDIVLFKYLGKLSTSGNPHKIILFMNGECLGEKYLSGFEITEQSFLNSRTSTLYWLGIISEDTWVVENTKDKCQELKAYDNMWLTNRFDKDNKVIFTATPYNFNNPEYYCHDMTILIPCRNISHPDSKLFKKYFYGFDFSKYNVAIRNTDIPALPETKTAEEEDFNHDEPFSEIINNFNSVDTEENQEEDEGEKELEDELNYNIPESAMELFKVEMKKILTDTITQAWQNMFHVSDFDSLEKEQEDKIDKVFDELLIFKEYWEDIVEENGDNKNAFEEEVEDEPVEENATE